MSQEGYVQVAPDSTGKKIRNLELQVYQPDGTAATVEVQVVTLMDAEGRLLSPMAVEEDRCWRQQMLDALGEIVQLLQCLMR